MRDMHLTDDDKEKTVLGEEMQWEDPTYLQQTLLAVTKENQTKPTFL